MIRLTTYYCQAFLKSFSSPIPYQLGLVFAVLLMFIVLVCLARVLWVYWQSYGFTRKTTLSANVPLYFRKLVNKHGLAGKVYLAKSKNPFAVCAGVGNPKIYISTALVDSLTTGEVEAVLLHEKYHLDNRDSLIMLIASITQSLLPLFPIISDLLANYRIDREIKADREAIKKIGSAKPIISVLTKLLMTEFPSLAALPSLANKDTLEPRIKALVSKDLSFRKFNKVRVFVSVLSFLILVVIAISPVQALPKQDKICPVGIGPYSQDANASRLYSSKPVSSVAP